MVLIPLNSGLVFTARNAELAARNAVLIPLNSGLVFTVTFGNKADIALTVLIPLNSGLVFTGPHTLSSPKNQAS